MLDSQIPSLYIFHRKKKQATILKVAWGQIDVVKKEILLCKSSLVCLWEEQIGVWKMKEQQLSRIGEEDINIIQGRGWKASSSVSSLQNMCVTIYNIKQLFTTHFPRDSIWLKAKQRASGIELRKSSLNFEIKSKFEKSHGFLQVSQDVCKTLMPLNFWQSGCPRVGKEPLV